MKKEKTTKTVFAKTGKKKKVKHVQAIAPENSALLSMVIETTEKKKKEKVLPSYMGVVDYPERMRKVTLKAGHTRFIHIRTENVIFNKAYKENNNPKKLKLSALPTIVVKDEDGMEIGIFTGVVVNGPTSLRQDLGDPEVNAFKPASLTGHSIYISTTAEIIAFEDMYAVKTHTEAKAMLDREELKLQAIAAEEQRRLRRQRELAELAEAERREAERRQKAAQEALRIQNQPKRGCG